MRTDRDQRLHRKGLSIIAIITEFSSSPAITWTACKRSPKQISHSHTGVSVTSSDQKLCARQAMVVAQDKCHYLISQNNINVENVSFCTTIYATSM